MRRFCWLICFCITDIKTYQPAADVPIEINEEVEID